MHHSWTHALIHHETGILAGVARDVEEVDNVGVMGTAFFAARPQDAPTFELLSRHRDLDMLPLSDADSEIVAEVRRLLEETGEFA